MTVTVTTSGPIAADIDTRPTLLDIVENVCFEVGLQMPDRLVGNNDQTAQELLSFAHMACEEVVRRVDWGGLVSAAQFTGTGVNTSFTLPTTFSRLIKGSSVMAGSSVVRGSLTQDEWVSLPSQTGTPKYFRLQGRGIAFWPYLPNDQTVTVNYISNAYTSQSLSEFRADDDRLLIPTKPVERSMIYRWLRHVSQPYEDQFNEYEAAIADYADFDSSPRSP